MARLVSIFLIAFAAASCRDLAPLPPDPCDATQIEGLWIAMPPAHPEWRYDFSDPHLRQWIVDFGVVITEQEYIYATAGDTVYISGAGGQRVWLVCFPNDTLCEYRQWDVFKWSPVVYLRRL